MSALTSPTQLAGSVPSQRPAQGRATPDPPARAEGPPARQDPRRHQAGSLALELLAVTATGMATAWLADGLGWTSAAALGLWLGAGYRRVPGTAGGRHHRAAVSGRAAVVVLAALAAVGAVVDLGQGVRGAVAAVLAAAVAATAVRLLTARLTGPLRVVLVADADRADEWLERWGGSVDVAVVGVVIPADPDASLDDLPARLDAWGADLVAFAPGGVMTDAAIRRATWACQDSRATHVLLGLPEGIGQHRVTPRTIGGQTACVIDPPAGRPPRHGGQARSAPPAAPAGRRARPCCRSSPQSGRLLTARPG